MQKQILIKNEDQGTRLDLYLSKIFSNLSRSYINGLIKENKIKVNDKEVKSGYKLKENDSISVEDKDLDINLYIDTNTNNTYDTNKDINLDSDINTKKVKNNFTVVAKQMDLSILYEDNDILVVNKPAGVTVHPGVGTKGTTTLVEGVRWYLENQENIEDSSKELDILEKGGMVHRLDKDTSGLLVFSKNRRSQIYLEKQFRAKTNLREYIALLNGYMESDEKHVESYLIRDQINRSSFRSLSNKELDNFSPIEEITYLDDENNENENENSEDDYDDRYIINYKKEKKPRILTNTTGLKARYSCTHFYKVASFNKSLTLVRVRLDTGRTHQIRIHAKDLLLPVVGDKVYGTKIKSFVGFDEEVKNVLSNIDRQLLHARILGIIHPRTHEKIAFKSDLPKDFQKVLDILKKFEDN